jgi:hypothetical protein
MMNWRKLARRGGQVPKVSRPTKDQMGASVKKEALFYNPSQDTLNLKP